jgi:2-oxo-4-hydroxy-4-carboxy-5-ureidoimidazoline decarboxylase
MMDQVTLDTLNALDKTKFVAALGDVFEHSPWVAEAAYAARPFASLAALNAAMQDAVRSAGNDKQLVLIKAHPDLAGKAARAGALTADSTAEQASVGLDRLPDGEYEKFHRLNDAYKAKFRIPFIVCVRRHSKDSILREFERRLAHEQADEHATALGEIFRIVALRLDQRVDAPDKLKVHGRLSTHVLDNLAGKPAHGMALELHEVTAAGATALLARGITNQDGRTDAPLIGGRPVPVGTYELRFAVGDYYARAGVQQADPPFLGVVPLRFSVAEPEGHYHVPLLCTPWSYSTYRGS